MTPEERVWDHIVRKHGDKTILTVDQLAKSLAEENQARDRYVLISFLKAYARRKLGRFFTGRRGKTSRIYWERTPRMTPTASALGPAVNAGAGVAITRTVSQEVPVRPGVVAKFTVPEDLSVAEAERLAEFIKRLPIGSRAA